MNRIDIPFAGHVEVRRAEDGRLWVNVDGECLIRVYRSSKVEVIQSSDRTEHGVYEAVLGAMQIAEEIGGPEGEVYRELMLKIAMEAYSRACKAALMAGVPLEQCVSSPVTKLIQRAFELRRLIRDTQAATPDVTDADIAAEIAAHKAANPLPDGLGLW